VVAALAPNILVQFLSLLCYLKGKVTPFIIFRYCTLGMLGMGDRIHDSAIPGNIFPGKGSWAC